MKLLIATIGFVLFTNISDSTNPNIVLKKDLNCLAKNIYHEARGEPLEGRIAVALVTLNRATSSSICKAVYAPYQFSWTLRPKKILDKEAWYDANKIAYYTIINKDLFKDFKATHYHNNTVSPNWGLTEVSVIGNHTFYL